MNEDELLRRLRMPEDQLNERKPESANDREIRKTIVAFANSVPEGNKAVLFMGVSDDGSVSGCKNVDAKQKKVRQICYETCYPKIEHECYVLAVDGKEVVAVVICAEQDRPHFAGPAYVRKGSESVAASSDLFDELVWSRKSETAEILRWKDQVISVRTVACKLGEVGTKYASHYSQGCECTVLSCDAHKVRLKNISTGQYYTESLKHITINHDENVGRLLLVVNRQ